jgi:response regulator RpfG family c-di-GMP phosphodiesterase
MTSVLQSGIQQYRLITAEKELLHKTLAGSIRVLAEVLSLADPAAFGRTARLRKITRSLLKQMGIQREWWLEPAVLLSQVGCVTLPDDVSKKVAAGQSLDTDEYRLFSKHPIIGSELLEKIPRMEEIAACIRYQEKNFDGTGVPHDAVKGTDIPFGARLLKVALDFDHGDAAGLSKQQCLSRMQRQSKWYDPEILDALNRLMFEDVPLQFRKLHIEDLETGMVLAEEVRTNDGLLLVAKGLSVTPSVILRLENYHANRVIPGIVRIVVRSSKPVAKVEGAIVNE